uniref:Enoyl reductase (ER) domain-containing protein n=1 Tax=Neobodo designis TaxID=312471 RepID=A0A7S1PXV7_NEODS
MASSKITVMAAAEAGAPFEKKTIDVPEALGADEVELTVESCGICHSDVSMWKNNWGMTQYPFVGGHEIFGTVSAVGSGVKSIKVGQKAGIGWHAGYCGECKQCGSGDQNLCGNAQGTIVERHGGWADKVRASAKAVVAVPEGYEGDHVGPLFCGGVTVFTPILEYAKPEMHVGVIGIGGLGSMAVQLLSKWGCHVTAFTSSEAKKKSAVELGAHAVVSSTDNVELSKAAGTLDMIISTVNVTLNWDAVINTLAPRGRLHLVGATLEPIPVAAFGIMMQQRTISGSPVGSPQTIATLLEFAKRHDIRPPVHKTFKFDDVNDALAELEKNPQGRVVLKW